MSEQEQEKVEAVETTPVAQTEAPKDTEIAIVRKFSNSQVGAMLIAYGVALGLHPEQFMAVLQMILQSPELVTKAFEDIYLHYARMIMIERRMKEEANKSKLILPPNHEGDVSDISTSDSNKGGIIVPG